MAGHMSEGGREEERYAKICSVSSCNNSEFITQALTFYHAVGMSKESLRTIVGEELTPEGSEAKMLQKMIALGLTILSIMASNAEARRGMALVQTDKNN